MRWLLLALAACDAASAGPSISNVDHTPTHGCPRASSVYGPTQASVEQTLPLMPKHDASFLKKGKSWLVSEHHAPCAVVVKSVDTPVADVFDATLSLPTCADADLGNSYAVVGDDVSDCKLVRLVDADEKAKLPDVVRAMYDQLRANKRLAVDVKTDGTYAWEIRSLDEKTLNAGQSNNNCPHATYVFVKSPSGIVQLDVNDSIEGVLVDRRGIAVVMTGRYGIPGNQFFDADRLPPHKRGVVSQSEDSCMR